MLRGFVFFALLLPQASQAHRRAEFEGFGLLLAGNVDGLQEALLRLLLHPTGG